jgi:Major Facilitator Superfamily
LSLLVLGAASGATDVAINADGVRAEEASGQPLMNLAHAGFSLAVVVASLSVGALRALGTSSAVALAAAGGVVLAIAAGLWISGRRVARDIRVQAPDAAPGPRGWGLRAPGWLLLLGAMTALAFWVENAWQSWTAVHLANDLSASAGVSALGPAAFAGAAAVGRLSGQRLIRTLGDRALITAGAAVAAVGTALAAAAPDVPLAIAGVLLAGAGTSVCAPTIISLAGAVAPPERRGAAVSTVTSIAYLGFLVGPAGVGALASLTSLRSSLASVSALALALAVIAALGPLPVRPRGRGPTRQARPSHSN